MEANPNTTGIILDSYEEIIALRDALDCLMDTDGREVKRVAERQRKQKEYGLEIVGMPGGVPPEEKQYAVIARAAFSLFRMEQYDEIFDMMQRCTPEQLGQMRSLNYMGDTEAELAKTLLGVYAGITDNELGKEQAHELRCEIDKKLEESRQLIANQ